MFRVNISESFCFEISTKVTGIWRSNWCTKVDIFEVSEVVRWLRRGQTNAEWTGRSWVERGGTWTVRSYGFLKTVQFYYCFNKFWCIKKTRPPNTIRSRKTRSFVWLYELMCFVSGLLSTLVRPMTPVFDFFDDHLTRILPFPFP